MDFQMDVQRDKPGVVNKGLEYEICVPSFLALKLLQCKDVIDFSLELNPPHGIKKLDDLYLKVKYEDTEESYFVQIKHKTRQEVFVATTEIVIDEGKKVQALNILDFKKAFDEDEQETKLDHKYLIFTNATLNFDKLESHYNVLNPSEKDKTFKLFEHRNMHQLQTSTGKQDDFFQRFYFISNQNNLELMKADIEQIFIKLFHSAQYVLKYIDFFREVNISCYQNKTINKKLLILQLIRFLLEDRQKKYPVNQPDPDPKVVLMEAALKQFNATWIANDNLRFVENDWRGEVPASELEDNARQHKLLKKDDIYSEDEKLKTWGLLGRKPIFVQSDAQFGPIIQLLMSLCRSANLELSFVFLGEKNGVHEFPHCKVFENLADLKRSESRTYENIVSTFKVSFQGRPEVTIKALKADLDTEIVDLITPNHLFEALSGNLLIGEKLEALPQPYIPRILLRTGFNYTVLRNMELEESIIISCDGRSEDLHTKLLRESVKWPVVDIKYYQPEENPVIILTDTEIVTANNLSFEKLLLTKYFDLQWANEVVDLTFPNIYKKQINAICAESGSGKTTFMKLLGIQCPLKYMVVSIRLKEFRSFFKTTHNALEILKEVFPPENYFERSLMERLLDKKNIMFLFDGLDELNHESISKVIETIVNLKNEGYKIWVFATTNVREDLEKLNMNSIYNIKHLEKEEMQQYMEECLRQYKVSDEVIVSIIHRIFEEQLAEQGTMDLIKTPLSLHILAEVLRTSDQLKASLTMTRIYKCFIDGKLKHNLAKTKKIPYVKIPIDETDSVVMEKMWTGLFNQYQIGALKICLEPDLVQSLNLENDDDFLEDLRKNNDFLGIVIKVNSDNTLVFNHHSFAIYFTATWLAKNFQKISYEKQTFIFEERYRLLRYFFNLKLAEKCPLHLAVLHNDLFSVLVLKNTYWDMTDKGGRTPLHLCVTMENRCKFPRTLCTYCKKHEEILKLVRVKDHAMRRDALFRFTPLEYADHSLSLFSAEKLVPITTIQPSDLSNHLRLEKLNKLLDPILYTVTRSGYVHILKILMEKDVEPKRGDGNRRTALHEAALYGCSSTAKLLLDKGADCEVRDIFNYAPLHLAVRKGHLDTVKILLENRDLINMTDGEGKSLLHCAAYWGHADMVQYFTYKHADLKQQDAKGKTALHCAVQMGHLEIVRILLHFNIDVNVQDKYGRTALHYAAYEGHMEIAKCLLNKGVKYEVVDDDGKTAREVACDQSYINVEENVPIVESNFVRHHSPEVMALHRTVRRGLLHETKELVNSGAEIEETDEDNHTPLHVASRAGHVIIVKYLLDKGAIPEAKDFLGRTPLHLASQHGHLLVVRELIKRIEDCNTSDKEKSTPLHWASLKGHLEVAKELVANKANVGFCNLSGHTPIHCAVLGGHEDLINYLKRTGAKVDSKNRRKQTCLHLAAKKGHVKIVQHLLEMNRGLLKMYDDQGRTALHWAAERGHQGIMDLLVQAGADEEVIDFYGEKASGIISNLLAKNTQPQQ